jgi:hypothetical protein
MNLTTVQDIERAIDALPPQELAELYAWLDHHRSPNAAQSSATVFEQGLGLFGSPDDAALIDEVVHIAYEERRQARLASGHRQHRRFSGNPANRHRPSDRELARRQDHS